MTNNKYLELKKLHQERINNFPMVFAFTMKDLEKNVQEKFGFPLEENKDKLCSIGGGGFILKEDVQAFNDLFKSYDVLMAKEIENDISGEGYIFDMFLYELNNHEYGYTYELDDTLNALGLTLDEINSKENLKNGLNLAKKKIREQEIY